MCLLPGFQPSVTDSATNSRSVWEPIDNNPVAVEDLPNFLGCGTEYGVNINVRRMRSITALKRVLPLQLSPAVLLSELLLKALEFF